jgi:hypothetical protein
VPERILTLRELNRSTLARQLLDVPRAPLPNARIPAPVRLLPKWDNLLLAFADRTRVLPEPCRKAVIRTNGDVAQTFLVDGFVAGIWSVSGGRVALQPFARLTRSARRELQEEAARLEASSSTRRVARATGLQDPLVDQPSGLRGIANVNVVPFPTSLSIQIRPPWSSMNRFASVSPRPVPSRDRSLALPTCWNSSKTLA